MCICDYLLNLNPTIQKDNERQQLPESNQIVSPVQQHDPQHPALSPTQNTPPVSTIGKQLGPQKHGIMWGPQVGKRQRTRQQFPQAKVVNGGKGSGVMMNGFSGGQASGDKSQSQTQKQPGGQSQSQTQKQSGDQSQSQTHKQQVSQVRL